jgi:hypothetical protein
MKSVQNLIFYLHKIFWIFSQFLAICFELFSFGMIFNSEIADERAPPVRRRAPRRARAAARRCHVAAMRRAVARGLKPLSGQRAARPDSPASRPPPDRPTAPACSPRHSCCGPKPCRPNRRPGRLTAHSSPSRRAAVSRTPVSCRCRLTEQRCRRVAPSPSSTVAARLHRAPRVAWAGRAGPRTRAVPTLCIWAECGFDPEALKLFFIFF